MGELQAASGTQKKKVICCLFFLCVIGTVYVKSRGLVTSYSHCKDCGLVVCQLNNFLAGVTESLLSMKLWLYLRTEIFLFEK